MRTEMQNIRAEIDEIIEATLANYTPPTTDLKVAARNFLRYGMYGHRIIVGEVQEGFCDNESLSQNPGNVPKEDLGGIMKKLYAVLIERGHNTYAKAVKPYMNSEFVAFNVGHFIHD